MKRYSLTETAKLIREALKQSFPNTKFSVRSKSYSGGSSITVYWTDGPTASQVNPILKSFEGADFDGMQDLKTYNEPSEYNGERVEFGVDYVFSSRSESIQTVKAAAFKVALECDLPLLMVKENGCVEGGEYQVPFHYYAKEAIGNSYGHELFAHDRQGGEWYSQLIYQVARATSFEDGRKISLPQLPTEDYINSTVERLLA